MKGIYKTTDGKWEARWREGSKNRGRRFDRKKDAESFKAHVRQKNQLGDTVPTRTGSITLAQYFRRWIATRHSLAPRTKKQYLELFEVHAFDQIGFVPMASLTPQRLEDWQAERLGSGAGAESIAKTVKVLSQLFDKAVHHGEIPRNPVKGLDRPPVQHREITPATPRQVEMMRSWMLERERVGDAVLISVLAYGGLRPGEALALRWEDFSQGKSLWVSHSLEEDGTLKATKTYRSRLVELPEAAAQDLLAWRREMGTEGFIFPHAKSGEGWAKTGRNNWNIRWFSKAASFAGLDGFPPKNLRHSCASLMIAAGMRSPEVAERLGHSLATSVRVYQRLMREMVGQPVRSVDEMIAEARTWREHQDAEQRLTARNAPVLKPEHSA